MLPLHRPCYEFSAVVSKLTFSIAFYPSFCSADKVPCCSYRNTLIAFVTYLLTYLVVIFRCTGSDDHDSVTARRGGHFSGRRRTAAVHHQRRVFRRRTGVEAVRRGGHVQRPSVQILPRRRLGKLCSSHVLVSNSRHQKSWLLHHQHLRRHGNAAVSFISHAIRSLSFVDFIFYSSTVSLSLYISLRCSVPQFLPYRRFHRNLC